MNVNIEINNKKVVAQEGDSILDACRNHGIHIPTLCHIKDVLPTGACRMCVVEDKNSGKLITSCANSVYDGLKIATHSTRVAESRKTIVELLLSNHPDDCLYCARNLQCELQDLSRELGVRERRIRGVKNTHQMDFSGISFYRDPAKCILCGRCVDACDRIMGVHAIDFVNRGNKTEIGVAFNDGINNSSCVNCGRCIMVCPTGALAEKNHFAQIMEALDDTKKHVVVQYAPSITVTLAEEVGLPAGTDVNGILNAALRKMGFDAVFDSSFSADLTIMEEASELVNRIVEKKNLPMFTSCCPAWVKYAEGISPDMLPHLSTCKSPMQMMGSMIKTYYADKIQKDRDEIYSVAIMPCTAKKFEAQRDEMTKQGISDVDAVLTTREFAQMLRIFGIDMKQLDPEMADNPMGQRSTAGKIFGASGGVMEAALRTAHKLITGEEMGNRMIEQIRGFKGKKEAHFEIGGINIGVAVVNGLANAEPLLKEIREGRKDIHFVEVMACPGGCINGGGQPITYDESKIKSRMASLYKIDETETLNCSHLNTDIVKIYDDFLGKPIGHKSHELLHTSYAEREVLK